MPNLLGRSEPYDAAILDLGLPRLDGLSILRGWREHGADLPVLVLTARGLWSDKQAGFTAGADDYLVKPFELGEAVLRVQALGIPDAPEGTPRYSAWIDRRYSTSSRALPRASVSPAGPGCSASAAGPVPRADPHAGGSISGRNSAGSRAAG